MVESKDTGTRVPGMPEKPGDRKSNLPPLTRRQALGAFVTLASSLAAGRIFGIWPTEEKNNTDDQSQNDQKSEMAGTRLKDGQNNGENLLARTAMESSLLTIAELAAVPIFQALKIPVGNAELDAKAVSELMEMPFYRSFLIAGVGVPFIEETIFRALPSFMAGGRSGEDLWEVGLPVSMIFALIHNIKTVPETEKFILVKNSIPLYQFVSGLFFWKMMRERGFPHSVLAHVIVNSSVIALGKFLYEAFPKTRK